MDTAGLCAVRRTKRLQTDEENRSVYVQTALADVSVAQVAGRYALNANMIFKGLRDARYMQGLAQGVMDAPVFLPIEVVSLICSQVVRAVLPVSTLRDCLLEIEIDGGHRLRVSGAYDAEALSQLIRGLSG